MFESGLLYEAIVVAQEGLIALSPCGSARVTLGNPWLSGDELNDGGKWFKPWQVTCLVIPSVCVPVRGMKSLGPVMQMPLICSGSMTQKRLAGDLDLIRFTVRLEAKEFELALEALAGYEENNPDEELSTWLPCPCLFCLG